KSSVPCVVARGLMRNLSYSGAGEYSYSSIALRRYICFRSVFADGVEFIRSSSVQRFYRSCDRSNYCGILSQALLASGEGIGVGGDGNGLAGELNEHHGAGFGAAFQGDGAAVVLHDFGDDGEAEAGAVRFAGTDEGIEDG